MSNEWLSALCEQGMAMYPFSPRVDSLVEDEYVDAVKELTIDAAPYSLVSTPESYSAAVNSVASYLSGSAAWYAELKKAELLKSKEFKNKGLDSFRKKEARQLRDKNLRKRRVGFLHQAYRFRGKANSREVLFLAHGIGVDARLEPFPCDLCFVLRSFLVMAGAFARHHLGESLWSGFVEDVEKMRSFSLSPIGIWQ